MEQFTSEELHFIANLMNQISWKPGQSVGLAMAESVIKKCNVDLEQKTTEAEGE